MRMLFLVIGIFFCKHGSAQRGDTITPDGLKALVTVLASDSLGGRGNYEKGARLAAAFISSEFKNYGLQTFPLYNSYCQPFSFDGEQVIPLDSSMIKPNSLQNIIGVLKGKTKLSEVVLICAHYDHLGTTDSKQGDTVYNGANDNASGTAAMLALANYFTLRNDNERTIIFCAFAGEELGLLGSTLFSGFLKPERVVAVLNLEMLGLAQYGPNHFFITGGYYGNLARYIDVCIKGSPVKRTSEPDTKKNLFARSDNYPFAVKGIPAYTFMSSDDGDACYHKPCDEVNRVNFSHMTEIVKAVATIALPLIHGTFTPKRIRL